MSATTQPVTADELFLMPRGSFRCELVKGELRKESLAGCEHGAIVANFMVLLGQYVEKLGFACAAKGFKITSDPDTVRAPDIAFVRRERIPESGIPKKFWPGAPDLSVEVLSPGDTFEEVEEKVADWLQTGASAVWIVSPKRRTVIVYRSPSNVTTLTENDELDGEDVVPGFRCKVSEIFV